MDHITRSDRTNYMLEDLSIGQSFETYLYPKEIKKIRGRGYLVEEIEGKEKRDLKKCKITRLDDSE